MGPQGVKGDKGEAGEWLCFFQTGVFVPQNEITASKYSFTFLVRFIFMCYESPSLASFPVCMHC